jgi:NADH dehydrogenase
VRAKNRNEICHIDASCVRLIMSTVRYRDKGSLTTIGRASAVTMLDGRQLSGLFACLMSLLVHFIVMFGWAWLYITYQRSARVILDGK